MSRLIDKIIFGLSPNENYTKFWNLFSPVYKKVFDIDPVLFFVGTDEELKRAELSTEYGDVYRLQPVEGVGVDPAKDWTSSWAIFYGAAQFSDSVCATAGIDQLLLSDMLFDFIRKDLQSEEDKLVITFAYAYGHNHAMHPSAFTVGASKTFKRFFHIDDHWENEIKKLFYSRALINYTEGMVWQVMHKSFHKRENPALWGLDELYAGVFIRDDLIKCESSTLVLKDIFYSEWLPARIDKNGLLSGNWDWGYPDMGIVERGECTELHSPGRGWESQFVLDIVKTMMESDYRSSNRLYINE